MSVSYKSLPWAYAALSTFADDVQFGGGSRTCIGKNISLLEISKLLPELIRHYTFELDHEVAELDTECFWFTMPRKLPCKVTKRQTDSVE